jgi:hypothetical protein
MNSTTKQEGQQRDEKGRIIGGTPPVGFHTNPERRHNGAWKKEDTPRYKLEQMMKLSMTELQEVIDDQSAPLFEIKLATAIREGNWNVIKEMTEQVYGRAAQAIDVTTKGESVNPVSALTVDELLKLACK